MSLMSLRNSRLPFDILHLVIKSTDRNGTLCALAQTCKALSEPALGKLWHTMFCLVPLLFLIPEELFDDDAFKATPRTLRFPKECWEEFCKDESLPTRMLSYGKRIKVLLGTRIRGVDFYVHHETWQFLLNKLPEMLGVQQVMPNLKNLSLSNNEVSTHEFGLQIPKLFVSDLRSIDLTLSCRGLLNHIDVVVLTALQHCPNLGRLALCSTGKQCDHPVVLDLRSCLTPPVQDALRSIATRGALKNVLFYPIKPWGFCDIVVTPSTLNALTLFKSITRLRIGLSGSQESAGYGLLWEPSSIFPKLRDLRLGLHGPAPVTWLLDGINGGKMQRLYFHFFEDHFLRSGDLEAFVSSLSQFKGKLSKVKEFSIRANIREERAQGLQQRSQMIHSVVTTIARLFPQLISLKLKLFSKRHGRRGLIRADMLPYIPGMFPKLKILKLAASSNYMALTDIVSLAQQFPRLTMIGINFVCFPIDLDLANENETGSSSHNQPAPTSMLRVLKVRHSEVSSPGEVAEYLEKELPLLRHVVRSKKSPHTEWDMVRDLLHNRGAAGELEISSDLVN